MKPTIYAMIPARIGSQRLKYKNLALVNKKPLIYYAINSAKKSRIFTKIFINSDNKIFKKIAKKYKINFYLRPKHLGKPNVKSDMVVDDFMKKNYSDICVWVNPIAPLQPHAEIKKIVKFFIKKKLNSLITVINKQVHFIYNKRPINFNINKKFERTQDLKKVQEMVYSLMMWKTSSFLTSMAKKKRAILHGKYDYYPVGKLSSFIVKNSEDLKLIESIIKSKKLNKIYYHKIVKSLKK